MAIETRETPIGGRTDQFLGGEGSKVSMPPPVDVPPVVPPVPPPVALVPPVTPEVPPVLELPALPEEPPVLLSVTHLVPSHRSEASQVPLP